MGRWWSEIKKSDDDRDHHEGGSVADEDAIDAPLEGRVCGQRHR
jgi:hypothetical protein